MATEEEKLARLFNAAYLIQQHEPELANSIIKSGNKNSEYSQMFQAGAQQQLKIKLRNNSNYKRKSSRIKSGAGNTMTMAAH